MQKLTRPVRSWALSLPTVGRNASRKDIEDHVDVCMNCKVEGGCNDLDIRCELSAVYKRRSDNVCAKKMLHSPEYKKQLEKYVAEHGVTPYPEQSDMIARG